MGYRYLVTRREGSVEYLTLNRPDVRNAFNEDVVAELADWTTRAAGDRELRAVVLGGAGTFFCAGGDASWMAKTASYSKDENVRDAVAASRMFAGLNRLPVPLIGRIQGGAMGGGAGLAAVCDIVVTDEEAVFGFPEVKLGLLPSIISPFVLAKIGLSAARELFLTGARFSASRAREIGLVHVVSPAGTLDTVVSQYVREILSGGPESIRAAKALVAEIWGRPFDEVLAATSTAIATRRVSPEGQEGLRAFLEKRRPSWNR